MAEERVDLEKFTKKDILNKIEEYARNFTPEWNLSYRHPDAGGAIALIFADQIAGNRELFNTLPVYYRKVFTDMLGISPQPPKPARTVVLVSLMENTIPGLLLEPGTKFTAGTADNQEIIFEALNRTYLTEAVIDTVFMTGQGCTKKLRGTFRQPRIDGSEQMTELKNLETFTLFQFETAAFQGKSIYLWHDYMFFGNRETVCLEIIEGEELLRALDAGKLELYFFGDTGLTEIKNWWLEGQKLFFPAVKEDSENKSGALIIREKEQWEKDIEAEEFRISSSGQWTEADFVCTDVEDCSRENFKPFGETIALYSQCYIGKDSFFSKRNAVMSMEFQLSFLENRTGGKRRSDDDLKVIKRRNYLVEQEYTAEVHADEIIMEYYTGKGWKRLEIKQDVTELFRYGQDADVHLEFICPSDWESGPAGAYEGRCIRLRVIKAEDCYYQPAIHHYPVISQLKFSYYYQGQYEPPKKIERIQQWKKEDITDLFGEQGLVSLFEAWKKGSEDCIYLGFAKKIQGGPVNVWFQTAGNHLENTGELSFYYYGNKQWKRLKVVDYTENLSHSGTIAFFPPGDMEPVDIHGEPRYYLCIKGRGKDFAGRQVLDIRFNGVDVVNQRTGEEEDYYIEVSRPDMEFSIDCTDLLKINVWVNETGEHTAGKMKELQERYPQKVHTELNERGEIRSFYVLWEETERFESTENPRVYVLDRSRNKIIFGDGVHKKIPKMTEEIAFKVQAFHCSGADGNVDSGSIQDTYSNILFIDEVYNPLPAFGGSPVETVRNVLQRGAGLLSSHGRLITEADYIREIKGFSDAIDKVKCITGNGSIEIVLLMRDYKEGSSSFYRVREELREYLLKKCEITIRPEKLKIIEPLFVEIHLSVWMELTDGQDGFGLTVKMKERLSRYLDPVTGRNGAGWEPGVFPQYSQLRMEINAMKENAIVHQIMVTAGYHDRKGYHECGLEEISGRQNAVIKSGEHHIYVE